ncbi:pilus motility taxis protein HmpF [Lyngbya sp. CCY1209]|uniref:pilus motility taxis protein HmpF n=1 Tax=Lyngbya sp. CCY1209 TaxID=2886103 RepID=UPI002D217FB9|nr:pilus motility taxis protein HmpF [Lyngbya sp. CCY1209]MEB3882727.1 pilus motility taxis protein HmpF [Lyngbya sp. CCY1209]
MLYLAEVQKQKSGFGLGGGRAELKLLACQRGENNWSAVPGDDGVPADDANNYKDGTLVLVELNASKQVQRIEEGKKLVRILEDFSRLQDKFKNQQEEIEQWKESLTYQSQELNRREMEMEARREQMDHLQEELDRLEEQRQRAETAKQEEERLRAEIERGREEIETTRSRLQEQMREIEAQKAGLETQKGLSPEQAGEIRSVLEGLSEPPSVQSLEERIDGTLGRVREGVSALETYRATRSEQEARASELREQVDEAARSIKSRWTEWQEAQMALLNARAERNARQTLLERDRGQIRRLEEQIEGRQTLIGQLERLAESVANRSPSGVKVDKEALQKMPVEQLKAEVERLQQEWDRWFRLVSDQEEELKYKREEIEELQQQIEQASGGDRGTKEAELADERDAYQMLEKTLEGQRRTLGEREDHMNQYQAVLLERLGGAGQTGVANFPSLLAGLRQQQQAAQAELQELRDRADELESEIQTAGDELSHREAEQEQTRQQLEAEEQNWIEQRQTLGEIQGRVNLYGEILPPLQDGWDALKAQVEELAAECRQIREMGDRNARAQGELGRLLSELVSS